MTEQPESNVVTFTDRQGIRWFAWRQDGQRPIFDEEAAAQNSHLAVGGLLPADYVDREGPQEVPNG